MAIEWFLKQFSVPASWGATDTDANDISNSNVIVGNWDVNTTTSSVSHGYTLDEHGFHKLPDITDPRFDKQPDWNGINKDEVIVGTVHIPTDGNQGFILKKGQYTFYLAPGSVQTEFNGINDRGDIVGEVSGAFGDAGVLLRNNQFSQFQFPGSIVTIACDINNEGDIVGTYTIPVGVPPFQEHGFLLKGWPNHPKWYTIDGNNPTYPNTTIRSINDEEDIGGILSGNGPEGTHQDLGFVAEPAPTPKPTPTPW